MDLQQAPSGSAAVLAPAGTVIAARERPGARVTSAPERTVAGPAAVVESWRLRADAVSVELGDDRIALRLGRFEMVIADSEVRRAVLTALASRWLTETELDAVVLAACGADAVLAARLLTRRLSAQAWLARRFSVGPRVLLLAEPTLLGARDRRPAPPPATGTYRWAPGTSLAPRDGRLVLENPLADSAVVLEDRALAGALAAFADGCTAGGLAAATDLDPRAVGTLLSVLAAQGYLAGEPGTGAPGESDHPDLKFWTTAELTMHSRSRAGRHSLPIGGTYRFRGTVEPEPALRPAPAGWPVIELGEPTPLRATGMSLADAVERRRSVRHHDDRRPIRLDQLGSFLHAVQRMSAVSTAAGLEVARRPYPNGGRIAELELYPLVRCCDGLDPALYWYDSLNHRLRRVADDAVGTRRLLDYARAAAAAPQPQVLLVVTARISRLAWKYEGLCYSMALRDAGVLVGQMYLVATAMGLAPCALGTGDSEAFSQMAGIDPLREPVVGDFILGSIGEAP